MDKATDATARNLRVLRAIHELSQQGQCPTYLELCGALGFASKCSVYDHIVLLCRFGYLDRTRFEPRALRITDKGAAWLRANP